MSQAQLDAIKKELWRQANYLAFDVRGFGEKLMDLATRMMLRRMNEQRDPDGAPWLPLSPEYKERKRRQRPGRPMGVFDGILKDWDELAGTRVVAGDSMTQTYGVTDVAREHAEFGVVRPFYELSDDAVDKLDDFVQAYVDKIF